ncbi:MAG: hypothetical protein ACREDK_03850 [Thermoplasmata archaeon]
MPDYDEHDGEHEGVALRHLPLARQVQFFLFAGLVVLAVVFYVGWGVAYGVWLDNGLYAVVATLGLLGLAGMWLSLPTPPAPTAPR